MDESLTIEVCCQTWGQLHSIYERDLKHNQMLLAHKHAPAIGTAVAVELTIPSDTTLLFNGTVKAVNKKDSVGSSLAALTIGLSNIPQTTLWLLESSLKTKLSQKEIQQASANEASNHKIETVTGIENADELKKAEADFIKALWKELSSYSKLSPLQILQCNPDASKEDIRRSFGKLTKKYHPDRFKKFKSDELGMLASELFMAIRDAYKKAGKELVSPATTTNPSASKIKPPPASPSQTSQSKALSTDSVPTTIPGIEALLIKEDYKSALSEIKSALSVEPSNKNLQSTAQFLEGMQSKAAGDKLEFVQKMEEALHLNPNNKMAAEEIAQIRRKAVQDRKALLAKLIKKDK